MVYETTPAVGFAPAGISTLSTTSPSARAAHDMAYDAQSDRIILFGGLTPAGGGDQVLGETWAYDFEMNSWTLMNPTPEPSARSSHAMAYDAQSDRVILFGGVHPPLEDNETWAYDFETNTWTLLNPANAPTARHGHRMVYDAQSDLIVLVGGHQGRGPSALYFHDTWTFDLEANVWSDKAPATLPRGGDHGGLVYLESADQVIQFGGDEAPDVYNGETWAYNVDTNTWTNLQPTTAPSARFLHEMAYDAKSDRVVLFGGSSGSAETWIFDLNANEWTKMNPGVRPGNRLGHRMAYDSQSERVILFGGLSNLGGSVFNETWAYDVDANEWIHMEIAMRPSARNGHDMAYDAESDRIVLFGGFDGNAALADTWTFDLNTNTWTAKAPPVAPPARRLHAMAYDAQSDLVVMFGGFDETNDLGETWVYDFNANAWTEKNPSPAPSSRRGHRMAYDAESDRIVLFGGFAGTAPLFLGDTWLYDVDSDAWTQATPGVGPSALGDHGLAYDSASDRVVEFGGVGSAGRLGETWTYDVNTNTWTDPNPQTRPPALSHFAMTYDSQAHRTVLFGGLAASGTQGDTWSFDTTGNAWTNMNPAVRPSDRLGHRMAYDSESDRIVLFGGITAIGGTRNNETWAYDFNANAWALLSGGIPPRARGYHGMVYDAQFDRIVLFAGAIVDETITVHYRPVADTWALNVSTKQWTRLAPSSHPWLSSTDTGQDEALVGFGPLAYDAESDAVVLFKSIADDYEDPGPPASANETWALQGGKQQWVLMGLGDGEAPSAGRFGPRMAYDAQSDRIILFGGWNLTDLTYPRDTWAYDYNTNTWQKMSPAVSPGGRNYHRMAYDSNTDRIIMFGGEGSSGRLADTWAYDYETDSWAILNTVVAPRPRLYHAMAYDEVSRVVVLFGGIVAPGETPDAETWVFDPATNVWTQRRPTPSPGARGWHDMVYVPSTGQIMLFGGGPNRVNSPPNTTTNELWSYETSANAWVPLSVPPSAPQGLQASGAQGRVELAWDAPSFVGSHAISGYRIFRKIETAALSFHRTVGNVLAYVDTDVAEGTTYSYEVTAVNEAGESGPSNFASATVPDTTSPDVAITSPETGATVTSRLLTLTGTASDNVALEKVEVSTDGTNWARASGTTTWSASVNLSLGPNTISARATDASGNVATSSVAVTFVDGVNPSIQITSPVDGTTVTSRTVTVTGTASDDVALEKVELSLDGIDWVAASGTTSWEGTLTLSEGENTIRARATDTSGNMANASVTVSVPPTLGLSPLYVGALSAAGIAVAAIVVALMVRRRRRR